MKKIVLGAVFAALAALGSCIEDKGNYDYGKTLQEVPEVALRGMYAAMEDDITGQPVRAHLVVRPEVTYSDKSKLKFTYDLLNAANEVVETFEGNAEGTLDDPLTDIVNGTYQMRLTVTVKDDSGIGLKPADQGMKYYYKFTAVLGATIYTEGSAILVDDGGAAKLHFLSNSVYYDENGDPLGTIVGDDEGMLLEDVYAKRNGNEALPGKPVQIVAPTSWMGSPMESDYYIMTSNAGQLDGVVLGVNSLVKNSTIVNKMFPEPAQRPASMANPQMLIDYGFSDQSPAPIANKGYARLGYFMLLLDNNSYSMKPMMLPNGGQAGSAIVFNADAHVPSGSNLSYLAVDRRVNMDSQPTGNVWGWDPVAKRLRQFVSNSFMAQQMYLTGSAFDFATSGELTWNPKNVGLDMVAMHFWNNGLWLIATDGTQYYQLGADVVKFVQGYPMGELKNLSKNVFPRGQELIKADSKWCIDIQTGVLYFSSNDKVYRYDPKYPANEPTALIGQTEGKVSMLGLRTYRGPDAAMAGSGRPSHTVEHYDFGVLEVGTQGHLYWLDMNGVAGRIGKILRDVPMSGSPVSIYNRVEK